MKGSGSLFVTAAGTWATPGQCAEKWAAGWPPYLRALNSAPAELCGSTKSVAQVKCPTWRTARTPIGTAPSLRKPWRTAQVRKKYIYIPEYEYENQNIFFSNIEDRLVSRNWVNWLFSLNQGSLYFQFCPHSLHSKSVRPFTSAVQPQVGPSSSTFTCTRRALKPLLWHRGLRTDRGEWSWPLRMLKSHTRAHTAVSTATAGAHTPLNACTTATLSRLL